MGKKAKKSSAPQNTGKPGELDEIPEGGLGDIMNVIGGVVRKYTRWRLYKLFSYIPHKVAFAFWGHFVGRFVWRIAGKIRANDIKSIRALFKNISYWKARSISVRGWILLGYGFFYTTLVQIPNWTRETMLKDVTLKGMEHLEAALKKGKGVIIGSTHFGHIQMLYIALALLGYKTNIIANVAVSGPIVAIKPIPGVRCIPTAKKSTLDKMLHKVLADNQILFIFADFSQRRQMGVKFMGRLVHTPAGIPSLAQETGAAVVPAYVYPKDYKHWVIKFLPEVEMENRPGWSKKEFLGHNMLRLNNLQTVLIRKRPEFYFDRITYAIERTYLRRLNVVKRTSKEYLHQVLDLLRMTVDTTYEKGREDAQYIKIIDEMRTQLDNIPESQLSNRIFSKNYTVDWHRVRDTFVQILLTTKDQGLDEAVAKVIDYGLREFIVLPKVG
jgi:KDO2-lipid IV(A) lauroyltransferase